jgi:hypothetical protein
MLGIVDFKELQGKEAPLSKPQTYANHGRLDPGFHFFVVPVLLINVVVRGVVAFRHRDLLTHWDIVVAIALLLLAGIARMYALRVQDRVIRMEERIRIAAVASPATLARMDEFTIRQLVALRFAPYAELGTLADRALAEQLTPKQIKQAIVNWRPDTHRV